MTFHRKPRNGCIRSYQVCVTVLEARHLQQNINPMVLVKVGDRKRRTSVRERTDCPLYNEYFVFDLSCTLEEFLATEITIAVYTRSFPGRFKFYGSALFEMSNVWYQPDRQYYHKWAMLTDPGDARVLSKGYVKCNIIANVRGERMRIKAETGGADVIEENLLLPIGAEKLSSIGERASYIFTVYHGEDLAEMASSSNGTDSARVNCFYAQITFAGIKAKTRKSWHLCAPRFNQRLIFQDAFPPFCHRIGISLKRKNGGCEKRSSSVIASHAIDLLTISPGGDYGFLPTYGPSFLHFYAEDTWKKRSSNCLADQSGSSLPPFYHGRILLSLNTEIEPPDANAGRKVRVEEAIPIDEKTLWKKEEYIFVAILYQVCSLDRYRRVGSKSMSFEASMGNTVGHCDVAPDGSLDDAPRVGSRKPCLCVKSRWPNHNWRMYNSNLLSRIFRYLVGESFNLVALGHSDAYKTHNEIIRTLRIYCVEYLGALETARLDQEGAATTKLDRHRVNICRKRIEQVLREININGELSNNDRVKIAMLHAYRYLRKIEALRKDPQHALPDIFLWIIVDSKSVAYIRLPAEDIIYSEEAEQSGRYCGRTISVFAKSLVDRTTSDHDPCRIELFPWLGNARFAPACWSAVPPGYLTDDSTIDTDSFPPYIQYLQSSMFQLRAHIFQGRFDPGMDSSGLMDPFLQVEFGDYTCSTKVARQSLDPSWDQTLVFPPLRLYGTDEYLKRSPPKAILRAFDRDLFGTDELCGRCVVVPLVKLLKETYAPPDFPPKLSWYEFESQGDRDGSVLAAFELIEIRIDSDDIANVPIQSTMANDRVYGIPADVRPAMSSYRLEVVFWGVRDMARINCIPVRRPTIIVGCSGMRIKSEILRNARKLSNFTKSHILIDLNMPDEDIYLPPVTIKAYDARGFGCFKYAGVCVIPSAKVFLEQLITERDYRSTILGPRAGGESQTIKFATDPHRDYDIPLATGDGDGDELSRGEGWTDSALSRAIRVAGRFLAFSASSHQQPRDRDTRRIDQSFDIREENLDWWSRYFASVEESRRKGDEKEASKFGRRCDRVTTFEIYAAELEVQPQFREFQDRLSSFHLWRGKETRKPRYELDNLAGIFKGHISIYRWPRVDKSPCKTSSGKDAANGLCTDYPSQEPIKLLVRLYVVKGINLHPSDPLSGKSDPYLCIKIGKRVISDKKNYIPNQLNPTFGRLFQMEATFPQDYLLTVQVWDYDSTTSDDLIGETQIDIENRFYSGHRAHCGLAKIYRSTGYDAWRDYEKPRQILNRLCRRNNLPMPEYSRKSVQIGKCKFPIEASGSIEDSENMALSVLHRWQDFPICGCALVPEHVERRPLFNRRRPGLEQGKLELWIDIFQIGQMPIKAAVDITPQSPEEYEIRVIVWNTESVPLVESQFLTGDKCSDIYVKGWILREDCQRTDIHYNSLTGEGNFNWRFVFRISYSKGERAMIVRRKISLLARSETEEKFPCNLYLQVWDSDHFSRDDFLGALTMDLSRMPRGSSSPRNCTLKLLDDKSPKLDLFKIGHAKAWWPFLRRTNDGRDIQAGKVELELSVVPAAEADENPMGKGRDAPHGLPDPRRPDTSFSWFRNPWKACCFVVCRQYRWRIIFCSACSLFALLVFCGLYAFPGYLVKRLLGA
ncbi:otoferlin [Prorops nasuta]|uniref:otoferlin n=1 Tax=Prorops nasuta TaxID=863751 RepID=UPI0034CD2E45